MDVLAALPPDKEIGLDMCNPRTSEIESVEFIVSKVKPLLAHRKPEQICLNRDYSSRCNFLLTWDEKCATLTMCKMGTPSNLPQHG